VPDNAVTATHAAIPNFASICLIVFSVKQKASISCQQQVLNERPRSKGMMLNKLGISHSSIIQLQ
jgi:hypothetical protein